MKTSRYLHIYQSDDPEDYLIYQEYDNGRRRRKVESDQKVYLDWLADGNTPDVIEYTPPPEPSPLPETTTDLFNSIIALWPEDVTVAEDFESADTLLTAWVEDAADDSEKLERSIQTQRLLTKRVQMSAAGISWEAFLTYLN